MRPFYTQPFLFSKTDICLYLTSIALGVLVVLVGSIDTPKVQDPFDQYRKLILERMDAVSAQVNAWSIADLSQNH